MNNTNIYSQIILSKTGVEIPVFTSGKTVESRYDPERESTRLLEQINPDSHFIIVLGIAGGSLINAIFVNRPDTFILAVETNQADIEFLKKLSVVNKLSGQKRIEFCTIENLENKIIELYVPSFYGNLQVIEQRGWTLENQDYIPQINSSINKAVGIVSADYSVQSHFGKLWQHNILSNILHINKTCNIQMLPVEKTALIVAAGPSLDKTIQTIKSKFNSFYIIATDTALSILTSYNIIPQCVISIDGQNISKTHFIHNSTFDFSNTLFLFDLCANSSAVNTVLNSKGKLCFFTSGHPLSEYINRHFSLNLPALFSGSGTVTISAVDFAVKSGFKNIQVAGADFSYSNGKPYAKGTYLDRLYNQKSNKLSTIQKQFSALEYRTQLIADNNSYTTQILQAYKYSFEQYLKNNGFDFSKDCELYKINCTRANNEKINSITQNLDGKFILQELNKIFTSKKSKRFDSLFDLDESDICLLPLISWLRNNDNKDKKDFNYFYEKALLIYSGLGGN